MRRAAISLALVVAACIGARPDAAGEFVTPRITWVRHYVCRKPVQKKGHLWAYSCPAGVPQVDLGDGVECQTYTSDAWCDYRQNDSDPDYRVVAQSYDRFDEVHITLFRWEVGR